MGKTDGSLYIHQKAYSYQLLCGISCYIKQDICPEFSQAQEYHFHKLHGTGESVFRQLWEKGVGATGNPKVLNLSKQYGPWTSVSSGWGTNYFYNRQQRVVVNGEASSSLPVLSGVPQGSILGPLLFIIYVDSVFLADLSPRYSISTLRRWHASL